MYNKVDKEKIKQVVNNFNFFKPYFEDEIPNTYPVPKYESWDKLENDYYSTLISNFNDNVKIYISSLYLGIPYCNFKCSFCVYDISIKINDKKVDEYLEFLSREIDLYKKFIEFNSLKRIYIGGGTPSILSNKQLKKLFKILINSGIYNNSLDSFTFEISPDTINETKLNILKENGVNRFSIGIQDINSEILKRYNRNTSEDQISIVLSLLREKDVYYNVDLIYGLQGQTDDNWNKTIMHLIDFAVPEFTLYNLRLGRKANLKKSNLSLYEEKIRLKIANDILADKNYIQVRPFHWVKDEKIKSLWEKYKYAPFSDQHAKKGPGMELGVGASALSHIKNIIYKNYNINDYSEDNNLNYYDRIKKGKLPIKLIYELNDYGKLIRNLIYGVENGCLNFNELNDENKKILKHSSGLIKKLLTYNLIKDDKDNNKKYLTNLGKLFYNNIEKEIAYALGKYDNKYNFSTIEDKKKIEEICDFLLNETKNSELKILELGSGTGSISIPIILCILQSNRENNLIKWEALEIDTSKIDYYRRKLIQKLDKKPNIKYELKYNNIIITNKNNKNKIELKFKNIDIERKIINGKFKGELDYKKYDSVFMPSFLNHIIFWKNVLSLSFNILKVEGVLVLGYPDGAWAIPEYGPTSFYDEYQDKYQKEWCEFWKQFYKIYPNFYLFFRQPFIKMDSILEGSDSESKKISKLKLNKPSFEIFQYFCNTGYFSFCKNMYPVDYQSKKKIDIKKVIKNARDLNKLNNFEYTFELIKKKDNYISNVQYRLTTNDSLLSKNIDPNVYSINIKERNKLLIYGIVRTLLGENILSRPENYYDKQLSNPNEMHTIVGSFVGNRLDKVLENEFSPDVLFFSNPRTKDIKILQNYMCFYSVEKTIPIPKILTDFLPNNYPLKNYVIFNYKSDDKNSIKTWADDEEDIIYIEICISKELLNKDILKGLDKINNKPEELYNKGNEIIAFPYKEKIKIDDSVLDYSLIKKIDLKKDELKLIDFFLKAIRIREEFKGKNDNEIKDQIKKRFLILAHSFLKEGVYTSIGIPLKGFLADESRLIGIIWLVYDVEWKKIESKELIYIRKLNNYILAPMVNKLNLILLGLAKKKLELEQLKTAIISILVDSYAHNISAHSLAALKWWFQKRTGLIYDKKINLSDESGRTEIIKEFKDFFPEKMGIKCGSDKDLIDLKKIAKKTKKYFETLGLNDSNNDENYTSLLEVTQFVDTKLIKKMLSYVAYGSSGKIITRYHYPVPIDYAIWHFLRFLRDKAGFWSGVTRDIPFGGESKNLYKVLWDDFSQNSLYLGTIAASEGVNKINVHIKLSGIEDEQTEFAKINLSVIDYEAMLTKNVRYFFENGKLQFEWDNIADSYKFYYSEGPFTSEEAINGTKNCIKCESINNKSFYELKFENENKNKKYYYLVTYKKRSCEEIIADVNSIIPDDIKSKSPEYAFVHPGKDHDKIRKILRTKDYDVFFPGGVVGEHAFFTLIENTLRNVKHYEINKDIKRNGLILEISIEPKNIMDEENCRIDKSKLFRIRIGLDHETKLIEKKLRVKDILDELTSKPIVDEQTGRPRLGGNSQDKICAAMLLNNTFSSVDKRMKNEITERDNHYYDENRKIYWIGFEESTKNGKKGKLSKYFHIWKSDFSFKPKSKQAFENENVARFKFVILSDSDEDGIKKARKEGAIRILTQDKNDANKDIYFKWLAKWLKNDNKKIYIKFYKENKNDPFGHILYEKDKKKIKYYNQCEWGKKFNSNDYINYELGFSHGGGSDPKKLNIRHHSKLIEEYFKTPFNNIHTAQIDNESNQLFELVEIIGTKVCFFDDRLFGRYSDKSQIKRDMLKKCLNISIFDEDLNKWKDEKKKRITNYNFLVIHLSFIEKLEDNKGNKYKEENINEFIKNEIVNKSHKNLLDNFILVITTGRGRAAFWNNLNNEYKNFVVFRPIESLLSALEDALSLNDDFQIKYNLIKVLFGS